MGGFERSKRFGGFEGSGGIGIFGGVGGLWGLGRFEGVGWIEGLRRFGGVIIYGTFRWSG